VSFPFPTSLYVGGVLRVLVDDEVEEKTRHNAALFDPCLYGKPFRYTAVFNNAAGSFIMKLLYDVDEVVRNAITPNKCSRAYLFSHYQRHS